MAKTVLITGAANGIGRALAEGFHGDGWDVVAWDLHGAGLQTLPSGTITATVDVTVESQVAAAMEAAIGTTGRVDVLFNNAGYGLNHTVEQTEIGAFEAVVAVHLFGALYTTRAVLPHMRERGTGHIINTLSRDGEFHRKRSSAYAAGKAGLWALTGALSKELDGSGIITNGMIPGPTATAIWGKEMPNLQPPEAVFPHAKWMADFGPDGPSGRVFWNSKEYVFGDPTNNTGKRR